MAGANNNNNSGAGGVLDNLIGNKGLKTDITVTISKETYYYLAGAILVAGLLLIALNKAVSKI